MNRLCRYAKFFVLFFLLVFFSLSLVFIQPIKQKQKSNYSSYDLNKEVKTDNNTIRLDYINQNGEITFASDEGYATKIVTKYGKYEMEKYYDEKGKNIEQEAGYYILLREYENGQIKRIVYLDINAQPVMINQGYAIEKWFYNSNNQVCKVKYYDTAEHPVLTNLYGYGKINDYNDKGQIYKTTYIDNNEKPMKAGVGYVSVLRFYYNDNSINNGKIKKELYYDSEKPAALSIGQYGVQKKYDEYGRNVEITFLDDKGEPCVTDKGYTTVIRDFYPDNTVQMELYYDKNGYPVKLKDGQYGVKYVNGQVVYLDANGEAQFNAKRFVYNNPRLVIVFSILCIIYFACTKKKEILFAFTFTYIIVILYITLMYRDIVRGGINLHLFWSYSTLLSNDNMRSYILENIWLFVPLGAVLYSVYPRKRILFIPIILSIMIETTQYISQRGLCELDDVISNGLGGYIGYYATKVTMVITERIKEWKHIHIAKRR